MADEPDIAQRESIIQLLHLDNHMPAMLPVNDDGYENPPMPTVAPLVPMNIVPHATTSSRVRTEGKKARIEPLKSCEFTAPCLEWTNPSQAQNSIRHPLPSRYPALPPNPTFRLSLHPGNLMLGTQAMTIPRKLNRMAGGNLVIRGRTTGSILETTLVAEGMMYEGRTNHAHLRTQTTTQGN